MGCFILLYDGCVRRKAAAVMEELPDDENQFSPALEMPFIKSSLSWEECEAFLTSARRWSDLRGSGAAVRGQA